MKKLLLILAVIIGTGVLFQNCQKSDFVVITGIVMDSATNTPITNAVIYANGKTIVTKSDGAFTIANAKAGMVTLSVSSLNGHNAQSKTVNISEGRVTKVNFILNKPGSPEIENLAIKKITGNSATLRGIVNVGAGDIVQSYGHCWSSYTSSPTIYNSVYSVFSNNGNSYYESNITGLVARTTYYVRAYVVTSSGVFYSNVVSFITESPELIAFYPFNGNNYDLSGNGLNLYGYSPIYTNDRISNSNSALACQSLFYSYTYSSLFNTFNNFSVSFWFYKTSWSGSNQPMINTGYPSYTNEIRIGEDNSANKIYFDIVTGTGTLYKVWAASAPLLNTWHHVVAQRNSSSIELYIDGVLQGSTICNNQIIDHNTYGWGYSFFFIGFDISTSGWSYFDGSLDDIRVYDRVLTDTEIQFLKSN